MPDRKRCDRPDFLACLQGAEDVRVQDLEGQVRVHPGDTKRLPGRLGRTDRRQARWEEGEVLRAAQGEASKLGLARGVHQPTEVGEAGIQRKLDVDLTGERLLAPLLCECHL